MPTLHALARLLIVSGLLLVAAGGLLLLADRLPFLGSLGRLPGDLVVRRGPVTFYLPVATSLLLSLILTLLLALFFRR